MTIQEIAQEQINKDNDAKRVTLAKKCLIHKNEAETFIKRVDRVMTLLDVNKYDEAYQLYKTEVNLLTIINYANQTRNCIEERSQEERA